MAGGTALCGGESAASQVMGGMNEAASRPLRSMVSRVAKEQSVRKHPFQMCDGPAARVARMRRWLRETRPRLAEVEGAARAPGTGLLRQPGSPKNNRDQAIGVPRDGGAAHWGLSVGLRRAAPLLG